jgi:hypothetical protein
MAAMAGDRYKSQAKKKHSSSKNLIIGREAQKVNGNGSATNAGR